MSIYHDAHWLGGVTAEEPPRILTHMTRDECTDLFGGNMSELSRALGISRQAVHKRRKNDYVPLWWTERLAEFFR